MEDIEYNDMCRYCAETDCCDDCPYDEPCNILCGQHIFHFNKNSCFNDLTEVQKIFVNSVEFN